MNKPFNIHTLLFIPLILSSAFSLNGQLFSMPILKVDQSALQPDTANTTAAGLPVQNLSIVIQNDNPVYIDKSKGVALHMELIKPDKTTDLKILQIDPDPYNKIKILQINPDPDNTGKILIVDPETGSSDTQTEEILRNFLKYHESKTRGKTAEKKPEP